MNLKTNSMMIKKTDCVLLLCIVGILLSPWSKDLYAQQKVIKTTKKIDTAANTKKVPKRAQNTKKSSKRAVIEKRIMQLRLDLEKKPEDEPRLVELSQLLLRLAKYQEALTHLEAAQKLNEQNSKTTYLTAFTLRKLKRYPQAIEAYEAFLNIAKDTERLSGIFGLANTYDLRGDTQGAIEQYEIFINEEKRPSQQRWVKEAKTSLTRLKASEVALIDTDTEEDVPLQKNEQNTSSTTSKQGFSKLLAQADEFFANRDYQQASSLYEQLSKRDLPKDIKLQMFYYSGVSYYLQSKFKKAKDSAVQGLLIDDKIEVLKGLAILSKVQEKRTQNKGKTKGSVKSKLSSIRLALKEGRFLDTLKMVEIMIKQNPQKLDPLLLHAKGRALLGLEKYKQAFHNLKKASKGLIYPHLLLDIALAADGMKQRKIALEYYQKLFHLTRPKGNAKKSPLHIQAEKALK